MASKSKSTDVTTARTSNNVTDRRAVMQRGQQILDSVISSVDHVVVKTAMAQAESMISNMSNQNSVNVAELLAVIERIQVMASKNQIQMQAFGFEALKTAQRDLQAMRASGDMVIKLADQTTGAAMNMAQSVARDQARANATALEIVAETKTGDFADTLKSMSAMVMGFTLIAIMILKGK